MIGIDLDNTIIDYSEAFPKAARQMDLERFGAIPASKHAIRQWLQGIGRNDVWTELQGQVYGPGIIHATPFPGALEFINALKEQERQFCIVSHKTVFPAIGPKVNLRDAAMDWLKSKGVLEDEVRSNFERHSIYFHSTREAKVSQIAELGCSHFIDDLPEVFDEAHFPVGTMKLHFDPDGSFSDHPGRKRFRHWRDIQEWILRP